jgi:DNA invertase Pin-like site-specific DNA recombinase
LVDAEYSDGGFSGGTLERPALKRLMADRRQGLIDTIVVYIRRSLRRSCLKVADTH